MLDAARGASAARITAVIPHYAYARSDKKDAPRISIAARLVADLIATAGANRVLTMTLHSPQVHGFFSVPVDHLNALRVFPTLAVVLVGDDPASAIYVRNKTRAAREAHVVAITGWGLEADRQGEAALAGAERGGAREHDEMPPHQP